jgi:murein DD-endopeptidase MepM/ murein hydrolase activator NlpD
MALGLLAGIGLGLLILILWARSGLEPGPGIGTRVKAGPAQRRQAPPAAEEGGEERAAPPGSAAGEPRPGDLVGLGEPAVDLDRRPIEAIDAERHLLLAEIGDIERRIRTLGETAQARKARLRGRLRALYKLLQGGWSRLALGGETPSELYHRRDGARRILGRDIEELLALRAELRDLDRERSALGGAMERAGRLEEAAARARGEAAARPLAGLGQRRGLLPRPVSPGEVLQTYGRLALSERLEVFHHGVELSAEPGGPVRAVAPGQVRYTGEVAGYGQGVIVEHEGGYLTLYARLGPPAVVVGDTVSAGTKLGAASLPKVYFQLALGDVPLDPERWFASRIAGKRGM